MLASLNKTKKGHAVIEYVMLIIFVVGSIFVMQKYVARNISGRWKSVGESFGFGRQYDPKKTIECDYYANEDIWYNAQCYEENCDCESDKVKCIEEECLDNYKELCHDCKIECNNIPDCNPQTN